MPAAPKPANEEQRLDALWSYEILDTGPESAFDALTSLAAELCEVPIATVTLVDESRQWFKSRCGVGGPDSTGRDIAFCAYAILQPDMLEIEDASVDPRFADNPLVTGETHYRFYAGVPLITPDGAALGTLCVLDRQPRVLSATQRARLTQLARAVVGLIITRIRRSDADDRRLALLDRSLAQAKERTEQLRALSGFGAILAGASGPDAIVEAALAAARRLCGTPHGSVIPDAPPPQRASMRDGDGHTAQATIRSGESSGPTIVVSREGGRPFSQSERVLLELVATMAGLALDARRAVV